ncbi:MAG: hypothetical protein ABSG93_04620 [Solirubrobacteraceae bacterium]|jgi:hypothetical protein
MTGKIPTAAVKSAAAVLLAIGSLAITAGGASAALTRVVYNNLNTVAPTVNGLPNEDTYSLDSEHFPVGGMVEFTKRPGVLKSLTTQVDSFTCEHGVYSFENCYTARPQKKFHYEMTAEVYEVGAHNEAIGPIATSTATFKLPYRPTTNVTCLSTGEGKGFGPNCDVGGVLATIVFKRFTPATAVLPEKAIITITAGSNPAADIVNVGLQASYKEFAGGEFVEEPAAHGGVPEVGSDPLPEAIFTNGLINETEDWRGFQPVFEVTAAL